MNALNEMMSLCLAIRRIRDSNMSYSDISDINARPAGQVPSRDSAQVQSVKRKLFGDVDHLQTAADLRREEQLILTQAEQKYNFDFVNSKPKNTPYGNFEWSPADGKEASMKQSTTATSESDEKSQASVQQLRADPSGKQPVQSESRTVASSSLSSQPVTSPSQSSANNKKTNTNTLQSSKQSTIKGNCKCFSIIKANSVNIRFFASTLALKHSRVTSNCWQKANDVKT